MKTKLGRLGLTALIVVAASLLLVSAAFAAGEVLNIPLNNATATEGTDCPATGGPYWHFVISPNNGDSYFITFHLNLGDMATYDTSIFVPNGSQLDNIFLPVPSGKTLTSLIKTGSSADIYWNGEGTEPAKFQLSHVCSTAAPKDPTVSKTAAPSYTRTFDWTIDKSADKDTVYSAGGGESEPVNFTVAVTKDAGTDSDWAISGKITVHNPNEFDVSGVALSDSTPGGTCMVDPAIVNVAAKDDATADYVCTFDSNPGSGTNTVTATWPDIGSANTTASYNKDYTFGDPTKIINDEIDVTDTNGGSWHFTASGSQSYQMTYTDPAGTCTPHENTATITQTGDSDSATVKDCQGADLTVEKTAVPSYDRTFTWAINKGVTPKLVKQIGGTATFNYTVAVTHDAGTDGNWQVKGKITITNPNDWEAVDVDLADSIPAASCTDLSGPITVPAGKSVSKDYTCTFSSNPGSGTNTATITWDKDAAHTPSGSASGTADFTFGDPTNLIDECVNVTDSYAGVLGKVCVGDANPTTFTYSRTVPVPTWECKAYSNTATFTTNDTGTTGSASKVVKVCGPAKTGALTIGFWQNKNGQGIITGGASTAGVCNSGTWLRQFAPFKDLSATATCAQVGTYVTNVIKAANASGSSMNAMLKAQMLATALDVYFSDPALGGNKIKAPKPIGGVKIDLTKPNVSAAFGGATKMTVMEMLTYAASQSNAGGTIWYGQVKATQGLAKNAFDAINNQRAFRAF